MSAAFREMKAEDKARAAASSQDSSDFSPLLPSLPARLGLAFEVALFPVCRSLTAALVAAKLDSALGSSWGLILLPLYGSVFVGAVIYIVKSVSFIRSVKRVAPPDSEEAKMSISTKTIGVVAVAFGAAFFFSFIAVLIVRLEAEANGQEIPTAATGAVMLWPVFTVAGVLALLTSCVIPLVACCTAAGISDPDPEQTAQPETASVQPRGFIEYKPTAPPASERSDIARASPPKTYGSM
jgi:hypothetical protein